MEYSEISYKKTSLSKVIVRIDFFEFIDNRILFGLSVMTELMRSFPKKGMQQIVRFNTMDIMINQGNSQAENSTKDGVRQEFCNADENKIILANKYIALELNKYTSYEEEFEKFIPILRAIMAEMPLTALRIGIRYINEYGSSKHIKIQKGFFTSPVSAFADNKILCAENISPIRAMAMYEYAFEDMRLNFRYGQYNPLYPQPLKQANFVLDYDCYCDTPINGLESILEHVNKGHKVIQELFEKTITEKLRVVMRDE